MLDKKNKSNFLIRTSFASFIFLFLTSCSSTVLMTKTGKGFSEKRVATSTLLEYTPYDFLRSEYGKNRRMTEDLVDKIAKEMKSKNIYFAEVGKEEERPIVIRAGEDVEVIKKVFIDPIGDFVIIRVSQGDYLVRDDNPRYLVNKAEYDTAHYKNLPVPEVAKTENTLDGREEIDYYNHASEEDRQSKVKWFCKKYPQFSKYEGLSLKKQLTIGMPEHLLILSWGRPASVAEEGKKEGVYKTYYYPGNYYVYVKNGTIQSWKKE